MATQKFNLTDRKLRSLKAPTARYEIRDEGKPGLAVRVNVDGTLTFVLIARYPGYPNPTRRALGKYGKLTLEAARKKAGDWLDLIGQYKDPADEEERQRLAEHRKQADTFKAVAELFISRKLGAQRRGYVVERIIRKELLPCWETRPVVDIAHRDVRQLLERVVDRGAPTFAHNVFDAINAVLNFAVAQDLIETNPCRLLKRKDVIGKKRHRQRVLNDLELRALWRASGRLGYPYGQAYRLLVLTGCRLDEIAGARWREFDLAEKIWRIPAERFKSDAEHAVPLSDDVIRLLEALPRFKKFDHLFSTTFGETPVNGFSKAKTRLDKRMLRTLRAMARARGDDPANSMLEAFVNHDIRRTVRTRLSALKVQDHVAEMVIGHGRKGIARVYDQHRFEDEKREALELWSARLRSIVDPPTAPADNVVPLRA